MNEDYEKDPQLNFLGDEELPSDNNEAGLNWIFDPQFEFNEEHIVRGEE